jgi:RNA polymerase sigma-70 factor (ECF subfamily)
MTSTENDYAQNALPDDLAIVDQALRDPAAFSGLYQRYFERVYRFHIARTGNVCDSQDLTAQTFTAALEGLASFRSTGSFSAWLFGIARRKLALSYRLHRTEASLDEAQDTPDPVPSTEAAVGQRLALKQVMHLLRSLAPDRQDALALCIFSELTAAEAGRVLGKSEGAVKMLVFRGLQDLRERCAQSMQEDE